MPAQKPGTIRPKPPVRPPVYVDCPEHGRQEAFSVPGLTGPDPICVDCI